MKIEEMLEVKENTGQFTQFWDMHSGGNQKLQWSMIYVNLPEDEAIKWFENRFNRNPFNVTCNCCGEDYVIHSADTLENLTQFERNLEYKRKETTANPHMDYEEYSKITDEISVDEYIGLDHVLYVEVTKQKPG